MTNETGSGPRFTDPRFIQDLARRLVARLPDGVQAMRSDLQQNFEALLQGTLSRLDLVTREEFEVQRRVLERTREKLGRLEAALAVLEAGTRDSSPETPQDSPTDRH